MGVFSTYSSSPSDAASTPHTHKVFLLCNYILLGAASSCVFLTLSLRLLPSPCGLLLIFLHALTAVGAAAGCAASRGSARWHATHMAGTVLAAIFQGPWPSSPSPAPPTSSPSSGPTSARRTPRSYSRWSAASASPSSCSSGWCSPSPSSCGSTPLSRAAPITMRRG
uniref:Uncharacterized protein n=1 Tax=Ananas comosus var. bracteatus TaxID=296719 RepID=A0A6V7Q7K7_ANACO|nr:unnamed protein product [Ananas comosus var. bracteatus]